MGGWSEPTISSRTPLPLTTNPARFGGDAAARANIAKNFPYLSNLAGLPPLSSIVMSYFQHLTQASRICASGTRLAAFLVRILTCSWRRWQRIAFADDRMRPKWARQTGLRSSVRQSTRDRSSLTTTVTYRCRLAMAFSSPPSTATTLGSRRVRHRLTARPLIPQPSSQLMRSTGSSPSSSDPRKRSIACCPNPGAAEPVRGERHAGVLGRHGASDRACRPASGGPSRTVPEEPHFDRFGLD